MMSQINENLFKIAIIAAAVIIGLGSYYFTGKKDNPIEEVAIKVIEDETGLKIE